MARHPLSTSLGLLTVVTFFASAFTPLPNRLVDRLSVPAGLQRAHAIVVLAGAGILEEGVLSPSSLQRALRGIALHLEGLAPVVVFSGQPYWNGGEARARVELARRLGVERAAIVSDSQASTTREEAVRMAALLSGRGIRRILLVTDPIHMRRARKVFEQVGFEVWPAPTAQLPVDDSSPEGRLLLTRWLLQEALASLYYDLSGYY